MAKAKKTVAAKKAAPKKKTAPVAKAAAAVASKADVLPDASVNALIVHSERLAKTVATLPSELALAKVTAADGTSLTAGAALLRSTEGAWQKAWSADAPGSVSKARDALLEGREDLYGALRNFADDDAATQRSLDEIAGVDGDDDLDADVDALVPLARRHAGDLRGTEITPAHVNAVEKRLAAFRAARAGVRVKGDEETTAQALSEGALKAQRARNEAFWTLAALNRRVCGRGRFRFRRDAKRRALFGSYTVERVGSGKRKAPAKPATAPAITTG